MERQSIDYLIDSAKQFYLNNFLQMLSRYTDSTQLINISNHQTKTYKTIIADIQLIFLENKEKELFYLKLFEFINRISGCLEDSHSSLNGSEYFSNIKIRRLLILHNQPLNWREILIQLRSFFSMIFVQLFQLTNLMFNSLIDSLLSNNQEMYFGIIQSMDFFTFYQLLFEVDISKMLNFKINEINLPQLTTDCQIYNYSKFISLIIKPLLECSKKSQDDMESLIILTFLSFHQNQINNLHKQFIRKSTEMILSIVYFDQKASNWEIYILMKIFTQIPTKSTDFLNEFQGNILKVLESMNMSAFLSKIKGGGMKTKQKGKNVLQLVYEKDIWKLNELIYFVNSFRWIEIERVSNLKTQFKKLIVTINEVKAKELSN